MAVIAVTMYMILVKESYIYKMHHNNSIEIRAIFHSHYLSKKFLNMLSLVLLQLRFCDGSFDHET